MDIHAQVLKDVANLKPLSQSAILLTSIIQDPNYKGSDIVKVVEHDPILTGSVLRIANSAAFARRYPIDHVKQALPLLGERMVLGVAFGLCSAHLFNDPLDGYASGDGGMWQHSLLTAIAAKEVARFARLEVRPELAFTAGLLHDLGKVVLSSYLKGHTSESVLAVETGTVEDYLAAESQLTGTNHSEVGRLLASHWSLPAAFCDVLTYHHKPSDAPVAHRALAYVVHIGDFIAMMVGNAGSSDTFLYKLDLSYREHVSLSKKDLDRILLNTQVELERTLEALYGGTEDAA